MDVGSIIISVSIASLISILTFVMNFLSFRREGKKSTQEEIDKAKESEARLVRMEADVAYIRQVVDGTHTKLEHFEERINKVETDVEVLKSQK